MLKSQGAESKCTYGITLPEGYLQVARWGQRRCLCIWCYTWSSLGMSSPMSTRVTHRLHNTCRLHVICRLRHCSFSVPTKETKPVYSHLGTHAASVVNSPELKIATVDLRVYRAFLCCAPADGTVCHRLIRSAFNDHRLFARTPGN